jgi:hypothetical protein
MYTAEGRQDENQLIGERIPKRLRRALERRVDGAGDAWLPPRFFDVSTAGPKTRQAQIERQRDGQEDSW